MTQNQIAYQNYVETKRANQARENETHRSNVVNETENERFHRASIAETNRANVARESETNRSNLANEMLKATEIRTRSEDNRYSADVGYKGRVDAAYINKWGASPTDVSSLASTIGSGVKKFAPAAKLAGQATFNMATKTPIALAMLPAKVVQYGVKKLVDTATGKGGPMKGTSNESTRMKTRNGGQRNVKTKKFNVQKY